jgi:hypothetical protein
MDPILGWAMEEVEVEVMVMVKAKAKVMANPTEGEEAGEDAPRVLPPK